MIAIPDFRQSAELYFQTPDSGLRKSVSYRRFATMAEAVSFAMERISTRNRISCVMEFGNQRVGHAGIGNLYQHPDFPPQLKQTGVKA